MTRTRAHPRAASGLMAVVGTLALACALLASPAVADHVTPARLQGETRFSTAANLARLAFERAGHAVIVTGEDYPDALTASFAAGQADSPILLVGADVVPDATWAALDALGVESVTILGGPSAVTRSVSAALERSGYSVARIAGATRYETAVHTATTYGADGHVGTLGGDRVAMLASGTRFADALAAGPVAAFMHFPLLLSPPDRAHADVDRALADLAIDRILIVGGRAAVSSEVEQHYRDGGYTVERIAGANRMATSAAVAAFAEDRLGWSMDLQLLARGDEFPDALVGSVHSAQRTAPILLTSGPDALASEVARFLVDGCPAIEAVRALGGTGAVSARTLGQAVDAADSCDHGPRAAQDFGVAPQEAVTLPPGGTQEHTVFTRFDEPFTGPVVIALFPCTRVTATEGPVHFSDADGDGQADGLSRTDTNTARILHVNATPIETTAVRGARPADDGNLRFEVGSVAVDCAAPVVFDDLDGDGQLDVDDEGHAAEPFGLARVAWRNS